MTKTIDIDEMLLRETVEVSGKSSEREAVEHILSSYVKALRAHSDLVELAGKVQFYEGYDPVALRRDRDISR